MSEEHITTPLGFSFVRGRGKINFDYKVHVPAYAREFRWTTEPPTVEGFYWTHANVAGYEIQGVVQYPYTSNVNIDKITHWLGPLPMPEPPQ